MTSIFLNDVSSSSRPNPYTLSVSSRYPKAFHLRETSGASSQVVSQKLSHQSINMHKYVRFFWRALREITSYARCVVSVECWEGNVEIERILQYPDRDVVVVVL